MGFPKRPNIRKIWRALVPALLLAGTGFSQEVSFKLSGGFSLVQGDDYNRGIAGENAYLRDTSASLSGDYKPLRGGPIGQFEIVTHWGRRLSVGLGGGYFRLTRTSEVTEDGSTSRLKPDGWSLPLFLVLYFRFPLSAVLDIEAFAGPVFQVVQFGVERRTVSPVEGLDVTETFKASQTGLGVQGGLGLALRMGGSLSLVAGALYRTLEITGLTGNWALLGTSAAGMVNQSGSESHYWAYDLTEGGKTYFRTGFFDKNGPAGAGISNVRKVKLDFSGFSVLSGIRISL